MLDDYEEKDVNEEGNLNTQKVEDKFILKKFALDPEQSKETIIAMATSKKYIFFLTQNHHIFCVDSKSLKAINELYSLPSPKEKNDFKEKNFNKIWADREGNHCIIRHNNTMYYFNSSLKQAYELKNFKGKEICAVGLDDRNTDTKTTKKFLAVDYNNTIYECCIEFVVDEFTKKERMQEQIDSLITIFLAEAGYEDDEDRKTKPVNDRIYGIKFIQATNTTIDQYGDNCYIMAVTKNRLFQFIGPGLKGFKNIFSRYENNPTLLYDRCKYFPSGQSQFNVDFEISYKNESITVGDNKSKKMDIFNQFGWRTDSGFCFGEFKHSTKSGLPLEVKTFTVTPFEKITDKGIKKTNLSPVSVIHTLYHIFILYEDCLTIISKLTSKIIYTEYLETKYKHMIYNEFSEDNGNIFLSSDNGLYQISLKNENDELWKDYLDIGQFEKAKGYCPEKIKKTINRIDAENEFQKNRIIAANKYALSDEKLEIICLKYLKEGDLESLKTFLEIYKLENIKQEENKALPKDEELKLNLIDTWIIELYLNENKNDVKEFAELIKPNKDKINSELIYQLLINYGKTGEYEKYSQIKGDYKRIIDLKINQGELKEAFDSISEISSFVVDNPEDNKKLLTLLATQFLDNSHLFFQKFPTESFSYLMDILLKINLDIKDMIENCVLAIMSRTDKDVSKAKDLISMEQNINKKLEDKSLSPKEKERYEGLKKKLVNDKEQFFKEISEILKNIDKLRKNVGFNKNIKEQIKSQLNNLENLYVFYLALNPANSHNIIDFLKGYFQDKNGKRKKANFRFDYAKTILQDNKLAHTLILALMGKYSEAISLALTKEPEDTEETFKENQEMAEFIAKNCPDKKLQKNLWIQIFINLGEIVGDNSDYNNQKKLSKALEIMEKSKVLKIEDVLPYITDSIKIEEFKSHITDCISQYEDKINKLKEDINDYNNTAEKIKMDINKANKKPMVIKYNEFRCEICGESLTNKRIFLFPCGHMFDMNCIRQSLLDYENTGLEYLHEDNVKIDELFYRLGLIENPFFKENELRSVTTMLKGKPKMKMDEPKKGEEAIKKIGGFFGKIKNEFIGKKETNQMTNDEKIKVNNDSKILFKLLDKHCVLCGNFVVDSVQCPLNDNGTQEPNFDL